MKHLKIDVNKKDAKIPAGFKGSIEYFDSKAAKKQPSKTSKDGDQKDDK